MPPMQNLWNYLNLYDLHKLNKFMGQNSDIHNIFESYSNKVLFKEQTVLNDAEHRALDA